MRKRKYVCTAVKVNWNINYAVLTRMQKIHINVLHVEHQLSLYIDTIEVPK